MIDINIVKCNGNFYSVKCNLVFEKEDGKSVVTAKILNVDLVSPTGVSTYNKLKNVFTYTGVNILNKEKYADLYSVVGQKLAKKFRMGILKI